MAIDITEMRLPITPEQARDILQRHTDNFGVFFDLDRILEYEAIYSRNIHKLNKPFRVLGGDPYLEATKRDTILSIVKNRFNVPEYKLLNKKNKVSVDATVRERLLDDPDLPKSTKTFIYLYNELSKYYYYRSYLQQYRNLPISNALDINGHRMTIGHPRWVLLSTSRMSAQEPSVQNIARDIPDILTCPKGWILRRADSAQIEPRINFSYFVRDDLIVNLITAYNDAYFGILHFVLASVEEERLLRENFKDNIKLHEITEELKIKRQTLKTLTNAGSYGSKNLGNIDRDLAAAFDKKIVNHPMRLANEQKVRHDVHNGVETFYGAFGTPVTPDETMTYKKNSDGWFEHVVRCGINNPVQTTASELMIHSIFEANKVLSRSKNSYICYYKHDEGAYYVSEDDADILDTVGGLTAYNVKGWIPISSEVIDGIKKSNIPTVL